MLLIICCMISYTKPSKNKASKQAKEDIRTYAAFEEQKESLVLKRMKEIFGDSVQLAEYTNGLLGRYDFCVTTDTAGVRSYNQEDIKAGDKQASFIGGQDSLMRALLKTIIYPKISKENGIEGKVLLRFIINENGELCNLEIRKPGGIGLMEESIRVMSKLRNRWSPAIINGVKVKSYYALPIMYSLA